MNRNLFYVILFALFVFAAEILASPNPAKLDNSKILQGRDQTPDAGVLSILIPSDTVDSNSIITPTAEVKNFGDITISFPVIFWDTTFSFYDIQIVMDLEPEETREIQFNNWQINLSHGLYAVKCSTALDNDVNNLNDLFEKQIFCRVRDIAVTGILTPDTIDFGETIIPGATLRNLGNTQDGFIAIFKISTVYKCSLVVSTLPPGTETTLTFSPWTCSIFGTQVVSCTTALPGDMNRANNKLSDSLRIRTRDFGVSEILEPLPVIPETGRVSPKILVSNYGNIQATSNVFFSIIDTISQQIVYQESSSITLSPGISDNLTFATWLVDSGVYKAISYTKLDRDINPSNDTMILDFIAGTPNRDIGVISIISPCDTILLTPINPKAVIKNFGDIAETFHAYFQIRTLFIVYFESSLVHNLMPYSTVEVTFPIWNPYEQGLFFTQCSTALIGDMQPENNLLNGSVIVETLDIGWVARTSLPPGSGSKPKAVKSGGGLVHVSPTSICAFKGNGTNEFYCYDIPSNKWAAKETIPWVGKKKRVKAGASLCSDNQNYIYALKGNNTTEFWKYSIQKDSWAKLADVPVTGDKPKRIKAGAGLAYVAKSDTQHLVYLLKGNGTFEFYAYWIEKDTWLTKPVALPGPREKKFKAGSCITYDYHNQCLWTLKGGTIEYYAYDLRTGNWLDKPAIGLVGRSDKKKKVKDGAGIAYSSATHSVYALKGGNTNEFWHYAPEDSWDQLPDVPQGEKGVKAGGSLVFANGNFYALRGNKTRDFYIYNFGSGVGIEEPKEPRISRLRKTLTLKIQPNPTSNSARISYLLPGSGGTKIPVVLKLYNITGRIEKVLLRNISSPGYYTVNLGLTKIPNGVYIIQLIAGEQKICQKVLIIKK